MGLHKPETTVQCDSPTKLYQSKRDEFGFFRF